MLPGKMGLLGGEVGRLREFWGRAAGAGRRELWHLD